jgi:hypothetical protein
MPVTPHIAAEDTLRLLALNQQLLVQALHLAAAHGGPGRPPYAGLTGSHLRHVIEHYEALLFPVEPGAVDYDARPRDPALETDAHLAQRRLWAVHEALGASTQAAIDTPLRQRGLGGLAGESSFVVTTSLGRELVFLASHTVHHFALLAGHCRQQGIPTPEGFGVAPATRAHARASRSPAYA